MILYHGSNIDIKEIDLAKSRPYKDFGRGFYLSADKNQALRMAEQRTSILLEGEPTINLYEFDEKLLEDSSLRVLNFGEYNTEWARFVLKNRDINTKQPCHNYDIVYGPIADDGVTFQLRQYKAGMISLEQLVNELKFSHGITFQYFFGTELAISKLKKI
ncbi:DUF3990 domain-containing protein [uncultured Prevotella sp.]|jgi:hypothetical protein|uniref:DUF3990 domain-containing protein n=1 Tax=uncultured Prevotella sp. TaxID=159272 RepID=UPI002355C5EE|nr:DUF3990 domain-containing protein [uncultured Prevotella sp.]